MTQSKIKVTLSDESSVLKNWEQACETDVSGLVDAVKHVKQSVNEYLTQLVNQEKSVTLKEQTEHSNGEEEEEEATDVISGFIKNMGSGSSRNSKRSKKQKHNYSKQTKKLKR